MHAAGMRGSDALCGCEQDLFNYSNNTMNGGVHGYIQPPPPPPQQQQQQRRRRRRRQAARSFELLAQQNC